MGGIALGTAVLVIAGLGLIAGVARVRFSRQVAGEARDLFARAAEPPPVDRARLAALPPPARRYLEAALGARTRAVRTLRLRHGGTFRTSLDGRWFPIRGEQYFAADPPGFVWRGRIAILPGLWVEARDRSMGGEGQMLVRAESAVMLADAHGPELDQGALLRLLGETMWFPTVLLDGRYVTWTAIDARTAAATLRVSGREVTGHFEFGDDGLPLAVVGERYRDLGGGRSVLTPFRGEAADFRTVAGLLVPHRMTAMWTVGGQALPYARFEVERLEYDVSAAF
jgi:uncharacterized protein DUF6544